MPGHTNGSAVRSTRSRFLAPDCWRSLRRSERPRPVRRSRRRRRHSDCAATHRRDNHRANGDTGPAERWHPARLAKARSVPPPPERRQSRSRGWRLQVCIRMSLAVCLLARDMLSLGGLFRSAWVGHFARSVLLALIGEGWKFALVQQSFDRLGHIACYRFLHLGFCVLERYRQTRELPMLFGFALGLALVEPHTMSSFPYSLLEIVDHVLAFQMIFVIESAR